MGLLQSELTETRAAHAREAASDKAAALRKARQVGQKAIAAAIAKQQEEEARRMSKQAKKHREESKRSVAAAHGQMQAAFSTKLRENVTRLEGEYRAQLKRAEAEAATCRELAANVCLVLFVRGRCYVQYY